MLKYDPSDAKKTKELLDEGEYAALIEDVTPRVSKAAEKRGETAPNMLELVLRVEGRKIWDYITFPTGLWKLEQIATVLGEADAFTAGTFDLEKKIGATVNVYLRAKSDSFGVKMQCGEYLKPAHRDFGSTGREKVVAPVAAGADDDSEAVPF
jgi:hypothetical protein